MSILVAAARPQGQGDVDGSAPGASAGDGAVAGADAGGGGGDGSGLSKKWYSSRSERANSRPLADRPKVKGMRHRLGVTHEAHH